MASARNLLMVKRAKKGIVPPPFTKITKNSEYSTKKNTVIKENEEQTSTQVASSSESNLGDSSVQIVSTSDSEAVSNILVHIEEATADNSTQTLIDESTSSCPKDSYFNVVNDHSTHSLNVSLPITQETLLVEDDKIPNTDELKNYLELSNSVIISKSLESQHDNLPSTSASIEKEVRVKSLKVLCTEILMEKVNSERSTEQDNLNYGNVPIEEEQNINMENDGDFSGTDSGENYTPETRKRKRLVARSSSSSSSTSSSSSSSTSSSSSSEVSSDRSTPVLKGKKRIRNEKNWKQNKRQALKNSGKSYVSRTGKTVEGKKMKPPCPEKCRLSCGSKFTTDERTELCVNFWSLSSLQRQRDYLSSGVTILPVLTRRIKTNSTKTRKPNCSFAVIKDGKSIRVCKTFLINTLATTERTLRTVIEAKSEGSGIIPTDGRGKHSSHRTLDPEIPQSIRDHINSIPRVESHYLRANTSREFVDGGLTIAEMYREYKKIREVENKNAGNYHLYAKIFNTEFNISFFIPKKDQCDLCESYKNADRTDKIALQDKYNEHQMQKKLSRKEKEGDIKACKETNNNSVVAIYDLQAVMPVPMGESSAFFYKSKLNCYNFTVSNIKTGDSTCYFWHEGLGHRGSIEIGSCVLKFLQSISEANPNSDVIFYSDNCCGQQKNRFIFAMYYYAVSTLNLNSVTHKFLIRGHTQNEGDNVHSTIEKTIKRAKKSGPIYVPSQYVQLIRNAKKTGHPYNVQELNFDDFFELKSLADDLGLNTAKDVDGNSIKVSEHKMIEFTKNRETYKFKTSYSQENWTEALIKTKSGRSKRNNKNVEDVQLKPAYTSKICVTGRKKADLTQLVNDNIVPKQYSYFYNSLF